MLTRKSPMRRAAMKRVPRKATPAPEKRHLAHVASMPCLVCGTWPVEVHHVHSDGMKRIGKSDRRVTPLCAGHHRDGKYSVHGLSHAGFTAAYGFDLLAVADRLWRESPANPERIEQ